MADIGDSKTYVYDITGDGELENRREFAAMGSDAQAYWGPRVHYLYEQGVFVEGSFVSRRLPVDPEG